MDIFYIFLALLFFTASYGLIVACDRLMEEQK
jgi:hypothetical protein